MRMGGAGLLGMSILQDFESLAIQHICFVSYKWYMPLTLTFMDCGQHRGGNRD